MHDLEPGEYRLEITKDKAAIVTPTKKKKDKKPNNDWLLPAAIALVLALMIVSPMLKR